SLRRLADRSRAPMRSCHRSPVSNEGEVTVALERRHRIELRVPLLALLRDIDVDEFLAEDAAREGAVVKSVRGFEQRARKPAHIAALRTDIAREIEIVVERASRIGFPFEPLEPRIKAHRGGKV